MCMGSRLVASGAGGWADPMAVNDSTLPWEGIHRALSVTLDVGVKFSGRVLQFVL